MTESAEFQRNLVAPQANCTFAGQPGYFFDVPRCDVPKQGNVPWAPTCSLVGGFNPAEKYLSIGMIIPNIWENKKCSCLIWAHRNRAGRRSVNKKCSKPPISSQRIQTQGPPIPSADSELPGAVSMSKRSTLDILSGDALKDCLKNTV